MSLTRFEYYIKKEKEILSLLDKMVMNKFNEGVHPDLKPNELQEAKRIYKTKDIKVSELVQYYWNPFSSYKDYNLRCKKVWKNMSKKQWELVKRYLMGYIKSNEIEERNES